MTVFRTNLITNPSFETNLTGWSNVNGSILSSSADRAWIGTKSQKVVYDGTARAIGQTGTSVANYGFTAGVTYTLSGYVWVPTGMPPVRINYGGAAYNTIGTTSTTNDQWERLYVTLTPASSAGAWLYFLNAATSVPNGVGFYLDGVMLESNSSPALGTYFDGDSVFGDGYSYSWTGTAHNSTSNKTTLIPAHDLFANAIELHVLDPATAITSGPFDNSECKSTEVGEPGGSGSFKSLWWKYTPTATGPVVFDTMLTTAITTSDTYLTVYTGSAVNALTVVVNDDDGGAAAGGASQTSKLTVSLTAGVTYYVRVGMWATTYAANITLRVLGPVSVNSSDPPLALGVSVVQSADRTQTVSFSGTASSTWEIRVNGGTPTTVPGGPSTTATVDYTLLTYGQTYSYEVRGTNALGTGPWSTPVAQKLVQYRVLDKFNRANSTTALGSPIVGPVPTVLSGTWGITANQAYAPSVVGTNVGVAVWECSTANVDITLRRTSTTISSGIFFGGVTAVDGWYAFISSETTAGQTDSHLGRFSGTAAAVPVLKGKNGPFVTTASTLRLIHFNGWVEMWCDSTLILRGQLPAEAVVGTKHGIRSTSSGFTFDDIAISDAPDITMPVKTGQVREPVYGSMTTLIKDTFVYRGRDTKSQDTTGVS